ncbi:MAG: cation-transporting P-type ATPase [Desulfohalobiaceae bacterium]|nr:cation-transporting P-type ATPase [Desulfohalobiaceae bacterium]
MAALHDTNFQAHAEQVDRVLQELEVSVEKGLTDEEAGRRLEQHGLNKLREAKTRSAWRILFDQFKSMVIIVLVIAAGIALTFRHWAEGMAIAAVLLVNTGIGFLTEFKAVRSMEALRAMGGDMIRTRRDGQEQDLNAENLVPGDLVVLEGGDLIPADIRLIESNNLRVNEAALTGESESVRKTVEAVDSGAALADRTCMLFKGTTLSEGSGQGLVIGTGMQTELGRISELAEEAEEEATPLQKRLDQLGRRLAWITLGIAVVIAVIGLLAGQEAARMIETAIALAVAAIPEGLPIVATLALARGMHLMAKRSALINKLPAVETLGATRIIFTDKTGTLTENQMTLRRVSSPAGDFTLKENKNEVQGEGGSENRLLRRIIEVGVLCSNASLQDLDNDDIPEQEQGDPTETALLRSGLIIGLDREELLREKPEEKEVPFDAEKMMMATYHRTDQGLEIAVKGAPSRVIEACDRIASSDEDESPMDDEQRQKWSRQAEKLAAQGLRVLAVADKSTDSMDTKPYERLRFLGLLGLFDPPREDVRQAIAECQAAGIRVIMVTGDQPATAAAIAVQTGVVAEEQPKVVHGQELKDPDTMTAEQRRRILETSIFARVSPEQKLHLIKLFQGQGQTVAMTGDGVNDAPALKKADIGVAMGKRGTDAARQVADMVLQNDAFSSIVAAVRQGRIIFSNIRKSVMFMLCTNVAEVLAVAIASVLGGFSKLPIPLLPLQILYLNVITDVFPAISLGMGQGDPQMMQRDPRPKHEAVLTGKHWAAVAGWASLVCTSVLAGLAVALYVFNFEPMQAVTVSFLTLGFSKLWFVFNLRASQTTFFDNDIIKNRYVLGSIVLCAVLLVAAVYLPGLSNVLKTRVLDWSGWALLLGMSLVPFLVGQVIIGVRGRRAEESEE